MKRKIVPVDWIAGLAVNDYVWLVNRDRRALGQVFHRTPQTVEINIKKSNTLYTFWVNGRQVSRAGSLYSYILDCKATPEDVVVWQAEQEALKRAAAAEAQRREERLQAQQVLIAPIAEKWNVSIRDGHRDGLHDVEFGGLTDEQVKLLVSKLSV